LKEHFDKIDAGQGDWLTFLIYFCGVARIWTQSHILKIIVDTL
jgi:hypothetical protein